MNCITVREPYASALIFGFKKAEYRNFKINKGMCYIHVAKTENLPYYDKAFFYHDIGAKLTAEATLIHAGERNSTKNLELLNGVISIKKSSKISKESNDFKLLKTLYIDRKKPYKKGQVIGIVNFTHTDREGEYGYKFANYCTPVKVLSDSECFNVKGQLSQFKVTIGD